MIAKAAAMQTKTVTVIDVTIIVTKKAKEAAVMMTGKKEITIVLVTLVPNLRAVAALQAATAPVLVLCQTTASKVTTTTMWMTLTWTWMKESYPHLVTQIQPSSIGYWRLQGSNPRQKGRTT
eukprot:12220710-Ditylum_brightwellii.AAC.1